MKRKIMFIFLIVWMIAIFLFSNMDSNSSNSKSQATIHLTIDTVLKITNKIGLTHKYPSMARKEEVVMKLNKPLRKVAHASIYCFLAIIILTILRLYRLKTNYLGVITLFLCFIFAMTDEFHQTFILGRTGQLSDVVIDTLGSTLGILLWFFIFMLFSKQKEV